MSRPVEVAVEGHKDPTWVRNDNIALLFLYHLPESKETNNNDPRTGTQALNTAFDGN